MSVLPGWRQPEIGKHYGVTQDKVVQPKNVRFKKVEDRMDMLELARPSGAFCTDTRIDGSDGIGLLHFPPAGTRRRSSSKKLIRKVMCTFSVWPA